MNSPCFDRGLDIPNFSLFLFPNFPFFLLDGHLNDHSLANVKCHASTNVPNVPKKKYNKLNIYLHTKGNKK